ncbi:MAG TPA: acyl carrier protein [Candidatus Paceibacterota bacterium]|nr:acyl carrier protein [Candidatus Paceibacterota bacterium]
MTKLQNVFASVLGIPPEAVTDSLSPETEPRWDSLNAIVLVSEIEAAFNTRFGYDEAMGVKNFGDAVRLLASKGLDPHA